MSHLGLVAGVPGPGEGDDRVSLVLVAGQQGRVLTGVHHRHGVVVGEAILGKKNCPKSILPKFLNLELS